MSNAILDLIKLLTDNQSLSVSFNVTLLIKSLEDLNKMIGMAEIKKMVVTQVKFLMIHKTHLDGHMLHCVISGLAGYGKTTVARILSRIWISLNIIKKPTKKVIDLEDVVRKTTLQLSHNMEKIHDALNNHLLLISKIRARHRDTSQYTAVIRYLRQLKYSTEDLLNKTKMVEIELDEEPPFIIARREDLVGQYVGQTAPRTKAILDKALGGVLMIDEAYNLYHNDRDSFGEESLSLINEYMSLHAGELIVIFAGYKQQLLDSIFKIQPGLARRCTWFFEIDDYTTADLVAIFKLQIENAGWTLEGTDKELSLLFNQYKSVIKHGGDTEKCMLQCKLCHAESCFTNWLKTNIGDKIVSTSILSLALKKMQIIEPSDTRFKFPTHMYL